MQKSFQQNLAHIYDKNSSKKMGTEEPTLT